MQLTFICGENRPVKISVNGGAPIEATLNANSWSASATKEFKIQLNKGYNVIRLYTDSGWMADIDCMKLICDKPTSIESTATSSSLTFNVDQGVLNVRALSSTPLRVVDITGKTIYNGVVNDALSLPLPSGCYVVNDKKIVVP